MSKVTMTLSPNSIQKAIDQLNRYASRLEDRAARIRQRVAEEIQWSASAGFSTAIASDIYTGGTPRVADVTVDIQDDGEITVVIASGEDAVFVEFGAGVYYNGSVGHSPHPNGEGQLGFTIGSYGKGKGKYNSGALPESSAGTVIRTRGTPAAMPMYFGVREAANRLADIAREVFNGD